MPSLCQSLGNRVFHHADDEKTEELPPRLLNWCLLELLHDCGFISRCGSSGSWLLCGRCPLASPSSAMLQETKRGSRYWRIRSGVRSAVMGAGSGAGNPRNSPSLPELSSIPSKLEVRTLCDVGYIL